MLYWTIKSLCVQYCVMDIVYIAKIKPLRDVRELEKVILNDSNRKISSLLHRYYRYALTITMVVSHFRRLTYGNALASVDVVALRWARLVLGWVTVRRYTVLLFNQATQAYSLPDNLRDPSITRDSFRRLLKTHLFALY